MESLFFIVAFVVIVVLAVRGHCAEIKDNPETRSRIEAGNKTTSAGCLGSLVTFVLIYILVPLLPWGADQHPSIRDLGAVIYAFMGAPLGALVGVLLWKWRHPK
jgi:hypothetical protein